MYITALLRVYLCHDDTDDDDFDDSEDDDDTDDWEQLAQRALIFCSLAQPTTPATRSRLILAIYILQSTAAATAAADKKGAFQVVVVGWPRINWIATALLQLS